MSANAPMLKFAHSWSGDPILGISRTKENTKNWHHWLQNNYSVAKYVEKEVKNYMFNIGSHTIVRSNVVANHK